MWARLASPGRGTPLPPPTMAGAETPGWGLRKGRRRTSPAAGRSATSEWIWVTAIASSRDSGGSRPGRRRASIVLPQPGGTEEEEVVAAGGGDLQRPLGGLLAAHLGEVGDVGRRLVLGGVGGGGGQRCVAGEVRHRLRQVVDGGDRHRAEGRRLGGVGRRHQDLAATLPPRQTGHREGAAHRPHAAVETQLADQQAAGEARFVEVAVGGEQGDGDAEVEVATLLAQVGRRQVDHHHPRRQLEAAVADRRPHPVAALAHRGVRQPDDLGRRQPVAHVDLDPHRAGVDPPGGGGEESGEHHPDRTRSGVGI